MTIKEVCEQYHMSQATLRYYERIGARPPVGRTTGGIRDYTEQDIGYVENVLCMRGAGLPVEMVVKYTKLCEQGDETFAQRRDLLKEVRQGILKQIEACQKEMARLDYKIERYETAVETGKLVWDRTFSFDAETRRFECRQDTLSKDDI